MEINFTIGWGVIEFLCHFLAAVFYIGAGGQISTSPDSSVLMLIAAICLTILGALI
jgi:hypothetical protein